LGFKRDAVELVRGRRPASPAGGGIRFPATARCRGRLVDLLVVTHPGQAQDRADQADGDDNTMMPPVARLPSSTGIRGSCSAGRER
jgi:hypothetical protein